MLFEVTPEASARRIAEALYAAEVRRPDAWRQLDEAALQRLRSDASSLTSLVPHAVLCLAEQLVQHPRPSVRMDTVRLLGLVRASDPTRAEAALRRLAADGSLGVQRAAELMLLR
jgi:hypothetical protein